MSKGLSQRDSVRVWTEKAVIPTYVPAPPERHPMFLEKRVYQGSSGRVYPLPCTDRISEKPVPRKWQVIWLENAYLRVMLLPELGGRVHRIVDKTNDYDLIYYQRVIKPALVGLAGPWISGGIEFNWPQHHRPATFLPVATEIETHSDGAVTVWCSDHDPLSRVKGMHGVCLHPDRAYVELKVRAYNRTPWVQTFLWWANVAVRVHEGYQSFFPPDVHYVADHARRAISEYPLCQGRYYGVDYARRAREGVPADEAPACWIPPHCPGASPQAKHLPDYAPNDLSWYANIPVPTSYMCLGSDYDFFGGYDHYAAAGIMHVADHHIAPGKKQWTWGNHAFGYAWDRNLTDPDEHGHYAPYIELMAGVYTDNQPDFSFLAPGEVRAWSQFWYAIQAIGPVQAANQDVAVALREEPGQPGHLFLGICSTKEYQRLRVTLLAEGEVWTRLRVDVRPGRPFIKRVKLARKVQAARCGVEVRDHQGRKLLCWTPKTADKVSRPKSATEPPPPEDVAGNDELYLIGLHLEQYRHATRSPVLYWQEALRRDPGDVRCRLAMGRWHFHRGEFEAAGKNLRVAVERWMERNPNPYDGEALYTLGLCLRCQWEVSEAPLTAESPLLDEAYSALYKATWNQAWAGPAHYALAEIDGLRGDWERAGSHCEQAARIAGRSPRVLTLWATIERRQGRVETAQRLVEQVLRDDPLDAWASWLSGNQGEWDAQTWLDVAHDLGRAGLYGEAIEVLRTRALPEARKAAREAAQAIKDWQRNKPSSKLPTQSWGTLPLVYYTLGWLSEKAGRVKEAERFRRLGRQAPVDYCFPARLEEIAVLLSACRACPDDARAAFYLGNLFYDRRRYAEAIDCWERSARLEPKNTVAWRNLGVAYWNVRRDAARAKRAFEQAFRAAPTDARLLYERDQLWKRLGLPARKRLREMEKHIALVLQRDDLAVELCALYNQLGRHEEARALLTTRRFQPWEGGEGQVLAEYERTFLALGRKALAAGRAEEALACFEAALHPPANLGEARHLLANASDIYYWLGSAYAVLGRLDVAREHWRRAATFEGDFQEMQVLSYSEMTYYAALAWKRLGRADRARALFEALLSHARQLARTPARIDYFATSLPTMLLFDDDLQKRQTIKARFLEAQARLGLGQTAAAKKGLRWILAEDPNHPLAADLLAECSGNGH